MPSIRLAYDGRIIEACAMGTLRDSVERMRYRRPAIYWVIVAIIFCSSVIGIVYGVAVAPLRITWLWANVGVPMTPYIQAAVPFLLIVGGLFGLLGLFTLPRWLGLIDRVIDSYGPYGE